MVDFARALVGLTSVVIGVAVALGYIGVSTPPLAAAIVVALFLALTYGVMDGDEFSVSFGLTVAAVIVAVYKVLPESLATRLPLGSLISDLDGLTVAVTVVAIILVWWVIDIRFLTGWAKKPEKVAKQVRGKAIRLVEDWAIIGRVAIVAVGMAGVVLFGQFGAGLGELGNVVGDAPFVAGQIVTAILGYLAAGGSLPVVGKLSISATLFAVIAIALIVAAASSEYDG